MEPPTYQARRYARACDACHAKKTKCQPYPGSQTCAICRRTGQICSFTRRARSQRKRPSQQKGSDFSALEERLKNMEALLRGAREQTHPIADSDIPTTNSEDSSPEHPTMQWPQTRRETFQFANKAQALHLARGYFTSCNMLFPVFNAETVLHRMAGTWPPAKEADLVWWATAVVVLLFAHRVRAMHEPDGAEEDNREASRYLAEALETAPKLPYGKPSLESVQVLLAIASVLRGSAMPDPARMFISCAIHTLQDLDAHKEEGPDSPYATTSDDRARVFWTAYIHDKNMAILTGKPPVMHESEIGRLPPAWLNTTGFGLIRSLDGSREANFLVAAYGLASVQGQVWLHTRSASLFVGRQELQIAQTALNPLLEAWKTSLPFVFKPECLVGVWPEHAMLYMVLLHFQYFQTLVELNKHLLLKGNTECVLNNESCSASKVLRTSTYSTAPFVVQAARDALDLASLTPRGNFQHVWIFFEYSVSAVLTLLVNGIVRPCDTELSADFRRVDEWLQVIDLLASSSERPDLLEKRQFLVDMRKWAVKCVKDAAVQHAVGEAVACVQPSITGLDSTGGNVYDESWLLGRREWAGEGSVDLFPFNQWHAWWDWEHPVPLSLP